MTANEKKQLQWGWDKIQGTRTWSDIARKMGTSEQGARMRWCSLLEKHYKEESKLEE